MDAYIPKGQMNRFTFVGYWLRPKESLLLVTNSVMGNAYGESRHILEDELYPVRIVLLYARTHIWFKMEKMSRGKDKIKKELKIF